MLKSLFKIIAVSVVVFSGTATFVLAGGKNNTTVKPTPISSPFEEGTKKILLSEEERTNLLRYADNSKAKLEKALQDADGLDLDEKAPIYWTAIQAVVIESFENKPRSELLMRHALNQALDLTFGIPDGAGGYSVGALRGAANPGLQIAILEDSIHLAIRYYKDDRFAIEKGSLTTLPYADFAQERLSMAIDWLGYVLEYGYQYRASMAILKHWANTMGSDDHLVQVLFAEEIVEVDEILKKEDLVLAAITSDTSKNNSILVGEVRHLRGVLDRLKKSADKKNVQLKKINEEKKK